MDFSIKKISESEYPSFTATTDYIAQICFHDGLVLLAQTATGKPVGMLAARNGLTTVEIVYVYVEPFFRQKGIATALVQNLIESADLSASIHIRDGHPYTQVVERWLERFGMEEDKDTRTFVAGMAEPWAKELHKKLWDEEYERIFQRFFKRGYQLLSFQQAGDGIIDLLESRVGTTFEYNTNPALFSRVDLDHSFCLFLDGEPKAFSLVETNDKTATMHLLSRARNAAFGSFLLPLVQSYTILQNDGYEQIAFLVYDDNAPMMTLLTDGFLKPYVKSEKTQRYYICKSLRKK